MASDVLLTSDIYSGTVDILTDVRNKGKKVSTSFGDQQAQLAKKAIEEAHDRGEHLFEVLQGKSGPA